MAIVNMKALPQHSMERLKKITEISIKIADNLADIYGQVCQDTSLINNCKNDPWGTW
jgi:hypothetical protein